jgi:hypothetical protein
MFSKTPTYESAISFITKGIEELDLVKTKAEKDQQDISQEILALSEAKKVVEETLFKDVECSQEVGCTSGLVYDPH